MNDRRDDEHQDSQMRQMVFETNRKSLGVTYLLWVFAGIFGAHRFYAGRTKSAIAQLILLAIPIVGWAILGLWLLADLVLIPGIIQEKNNELIAQLGYREEPREPEPQMRAPQTVTDRRRAAMLEDLRQTGYRKERRDPSYLP